MTRSAGVRTDRSRLLRCALKYAKKGLAVFPLAPNSKVPPKGFNWGTQSSTDPRTVRTMFAGRPKANLGIVTGSRSGIVVLDVDPRNGGTESLAALQKRFGALPETLRASTPSGGEHYFFRCREKVPNSSGKLGPGLDVRGDGGYVAARPSTVSGVTYTWTKRHKMAHLPLDLLAAMKSSSRNCSGDLPLRIREGERDTILFKHSRVLYGQGLSHDEVLEAVRSVNAERCNPRLSDAAVRRISRPLPSVELGKVVPLAEDFCDIADRDLPPLRFAVRDLLPQGVGLLVGPPKIGKSFLVLQVALAIVRGSTLWPGRKPERKGRVLYLAYEDSQRRFRDRVKLLTGSTEMDRDSLSVSRAWPRMDEGGDDAIDQWLTQNPGTRLVVIDTLECFRARKNLKHSVYAFDYDVGAKLERIASRHRVAILLVHHSSKGDRNDPVDSVNGTNGLAGSVDTIWVMKADRGAEDASLFVTGRDVEQNPTLNLRLDKGTRRWSAVGTMEEATMSSRRKQILDDLALYGPSTPQEVASRIGVSGNLTRQRLLKMREAGQVKWRPGGRYAKK